MTLQAGSGYVLQMSGTGKKAKPPSVTVTITDEFTKPEIVELAFSAHALNADSSWLSCRMNIRA